MKPYGLQVIEWPDVADIHAMGAKTSVGGKKCGYHRNKAVKQSTRRYWARKARFENKLACQEEY